MQKDIVIIPTYNECNNSSIIYEKIRLYNENIDILYIDDNSPDNTSEIIKRIQNKDEKVYLINREKKKGIGSAHKDGFIWAHKNNYNRVITIDADLSHDPILINTMLDNLNNYEVVTTGRFVKKDSLETWSLFRKLLTTLRHLVIKSLFQIPFDTSGAFRCYNFDKLNIEDLMQAKNNGYSFFWESLIILFEKKYRIKEIPIKIPARVYGSSKMKFLDIIHAIYYLIYFYFSRLLKKLIK
jgi:dolichol-phosphate mannosyltransferase